jgi:hypothetical protein
VHQYLLRGFEIVYGGLRTLSGTNSKAAVQLDKNGDPPINAVKDTLLTFAEISVDNQLLLYLRTQLRCLLISPVGECGYCFANTANAASVSCALIALIATGG